MEEVHGGRDGESDSQKNNKTHMVSFGYYHLVEIFSFTKIIDQCKDEMIEENDEAKGELFMF
jgi:hypothetical protein